MTEPRLVLVMLTIMLTWVSVMSKPQGGPLLPFALPKETFNIYDTRFSGQPQGRSAPSAAPLRLRTFRKPFTPNPQRINIRQPARISQATASSQELFSGRPQSGRWVPIIPQQAGSQRQLTGHQGATSQGASSFPNQYRPVDTSRRPVPSRQRGFAAHRNRGRPSRRHPMCGVLPTSGDCRAAFPRYYYNNKTDQCDCFLYGGCGHLGLKYSYQTLNECQTTCMPANLEEGPVCKVLFREEEVFFNSEVDDPPQPIFISGQQPTSNQNIDHLSDEEVLSIFINSVSPGDFGIYDTGNEADADGRRNVEDF